MKRKNEGAFSCAKKALKQAFSLVELMVTLIVISCIMAALVPSITKKLKTQGITIGGSIGGGGGSGGGGSGGSSSNYDPNLTTDCTDTFGANCELCYTNACITCNLVCNANEYKDVGTCSCITCADRYGSKCLDCDTNSCLECDIGYGTTSGGGCELCTSGEYSDGSKKCQNCPQGYYCVNAEKIICPAGTYSDIRATSCFSCTEITPECASCNVDTCTKCNPGYTLSNNRCNFAMEVKEFTSAGEHEFIIPDDVTKVRAIAISGGAGGGGGTSTDKITDFTTTGTNTWNIPLSVRGRAIKFTAVGSSGGWGWIGEWWVGRTAPGAGYTRQNISFTLPNQATIGVVIGAKPADATKTSGCGASERGPSNSGPRGGSTYFSGYNTATYTAYGGYGGAVGTQDASKIKYGCSHSGASSVGSNIFTTANVGYSRGHVGEHGAMRIFWTEKNPGTGGGTGQIAYNEEVSVIPGETLRVIVGRGGAGGTLGNAGEWGNAEMVSKIIGSGGIVYISSAVSPSSMGATGGNPTSTVGTAGHITDGLTTTQITKDGFSGSDGSDVSGLAGGNGGQTIVNNVMTHCTVGAGGADYGVDGGNAAGYGGCGGGGAGAGAKGGAGAPGYVKIELIRD